MKSVLHKVKYLNTLSKVPHCCHCLGKVMKLLGDMALLEETSLGEALGVHSLITSSFSVCFLDVLQDVRPQLSVPAASPAMMNSYLSGRTSQNKLFFLKVALTVVFYHSTREVTNTAK